MSRLFPCPAEKFYHKFYHIKVAYMCLLLPAIRVDASIAASRKILEIAKKTQERHGFHHAFPWYARRDSNPQHSEPESDALSN